MDTTATSPPMPEAPGQPRRLTRSRHDRIVGGVAGGVAEYFSIDPALVRIGFIATAFFGGLGVLVYAAAWLLVPEGAPGAPAVEGPVGRLVPHWNRHTWVTALVLTGVFFLVVSPHWWGWGPRSAPGAYFVWVAIVALAAVWLVRVPRGRLVPRRLIRRSGLALAVVVVLAVGGLFGAEALTGVPLSGDIGSKLVRPVALSQVQSTYRTAIGSMTVDLRDVRFGSTTTHVTASVGIGQLVVEVPNGVAVDVRANSGIGRVSYGSSGPGGFADSGHRSPQLVLDAQVGIGRVVLERGNPDASSGSSSTTILVAPARPLTVVAPLPGARPAGPAVGGLTTS